MRSRIAALGLSALAFAGLCSPNPRTSRRYSPLEPSSSLVVPSSLTFPEAPAKSSLQLSSLKDFDYNLLPPIHPARMIHTMLAMEKKIREAITPLPPATLALEVPASCAGTPFIELHTTYPLDALQSVSGEGLAGFFDLNLLDAYIEQRKDGGVRALFPLPREQIRPHYDSLELRISRSDASPCSSLTVEELRFDPHPQTEVRFDVADYGRITSEKEAAKRHTRTIQLSYEVTCLAPDTTIKHLEFYMRTAGSFRELVMRAQPASSRLMLGFYREPFADFVSGREMARPEFGNLILQDPPPGDYFLELAVFSTQKREGHDIRGLTISDPVFLPIRAR